ncbi:TCR/Tet family MFS transporter [Adhaeribacter pallidiroseus]|uniref:Major facilitator superfamily domain-containing protein n=1 Tax=Adhaeribacter pallidiroseus TaxID=2072847 RepID=A0A369QM73_9BACT|nr:TCR/Tet family MFS transporter [Adhaeribacter pallidiroseus]RDC66043.1 Major facilitator superfamily domain-containing protein [Adhaeribacter pallidiroseus]
MAGKRQAALGFIFVTLLIDVIGFGIIIPVIPKLISQLIHGNLSDASRYGGWLMFAFSIMQFLFSPVLGNLSDRYGRRPVLLISLFGFALDYLFVAFAPTLVWLFVGRLIAGITGASMTTAIAYIADISTPEKRAQNFGMVGAAFGLGFIIGPVIGGVLGQFGPRVPFLAAAGLTLINWLYGYFILPESLAPENQRPFNWKRANPIGSLLQLKRYPVIIGLVSCLIFIYIGAHATQSTWAYYTMEKFKWNEAWVGYSLGAVGFMVALVQGGLIRFINPLLGPKRSVYLGLALYTFGFVLFAFATKSWMMFAFLVPYCLGGIAGPAIQGIISGQVPPNEQGELQGALTSLISVTSIIGPPLMTNLFAYFTSNAAPFYFPGAPFLMGAVLTLISLLLAIRSLANYRSPVNISKEVITPV